MTQSSVLLDAPAIELALGRMAHEIAEHHLHGDPLALVGIQRGGMILARRLGARLSRIRGGEVPVGALDVSMHRDDLDQRLVPQVHPTAMPFDVNGRTVVLVDDVLFSGRTVRAALDALNDLGRPRRVQLAVLVDRGHRELPIKADYVGREVTTSPGQSVVVDVHEDGGGDRVIIESAAR